MACIDEDFVRKVSPGDLMVAGQNFGCGSSREHAPLAIKEAGISCVIAKTFARIFFRNAINIGLPIIECQEAAQEIQEGDMVEMDIDSGKIINRSQNKEYAITAYPEFMQKLITAGGLMNYLKASREVVLS
jgi:3-isopropylmalate/(R)-2-methylmalate dehydratase small subunit